MSSAPSIAQNIAQMHPAYIILSALIGGILTLAVVHIKGRQDHARGIMKLAIETAHKDFDVSLSVAKEKGEDIFPMSSYVSFHYIFMHELSKGTAPSEALMITSSKVEDLVSSYSEMKFTDYKTKWKSN